MSNPAKSVSSFLVLPFLSIASLLVGSRPTYDGVGRNSLSFLDLGCVVVVGHRHGQKSSGETDQSRARGDTAPKRREAGHCVVLCDVQASSVAPEALSSRKGNVGGRKVREGGSGGVSESTGWIGRCDGFDRSEGKDQCEKEKEKKKIACCYVSLLLRHSTTECLSQTSRMSAAMMDAKERKKGTVGGVRNWDVDVALARTETPAMNYA